MEIYTPNEKIAEAAFPGGMSGLAGQLRVSLPQDNERQLGPGNTAVYLSGKLEDSTVKEILRVVESHIRK